MNEVQMPVRTRPLNPQQEKFATLYGSGAKNATQAYAEAYDREPDKTAGNNGSRLLDHAGVSETIEHLRKRIKEHAPEAFNTQLEMLRDKKTPANVRNDIIKHIQNLSDVVPTQKVETKDVTFKGLNDEISYKQLVKEAYNKIENGKGV